MPRLRTLATVMLVIAVPSLFIYYLYYDSVSMANPNHRYQPSSSPDSSPRDNIRHKYAPVWRHFNHSNGLNNLTAGEVWLKSINHADFQYVPFVAPKIATPEESKDPDPEIESRRSMVKQMMKDAWDSYKQYAWGYNELQPQSRDPKLDSIFGPSKLGLTIVDSMDTLFLMDMKPEFEEGTRWIAESLDFKAVQTEISVFETIIRYVGGLLACFAFTSDPMFLYKAKEIGEVLLPAYRTATGIPNGLIIPKTGKSYHQTWAYGAILSEFGSQHLELTYLSDMTNDMRFRDHVKRIRDFLDKIDKPDGLYMLMLDNVFGRWTDNKVSLGALGDSFYEYLIKSYVQSDHQDKQALRMYIEAMDAIDRSGMINQSRSGLLTYVADLFFGKPTNKMQHLTCFAGGMYALGVHHMTSGTNSTLVDEKRTRRHFDLAVNLTETCYQSYHRTPTRLGPESFYFDAENEAINRNGEYYILRPEVIESYFVMWRMTHDKRYRDYAWEAAQAIHEHCRSSAGYAGIVNVMKLPVAQDNTQQSFFLAETLKYLYLIFSNDKLLPLDQWVFNTEAHPLPICGRNQAYPFFTCNANRNGSVVQSP